MSTIVRHNERSREIDMITQINMIAKENDLFIKRAGGESTVSTKQDNAMFPDVILYGNEDQSVILQGWELKMPDVEIENEEFIKNAQKKAVALGLNSFLLWNFTYAVLYEENGKDQFSIIKQWTDTNYIRTREDVDTYKQDWEQLLEKVLLELNQYFVKGQLKSASIANVISTSAVTTIIDRNKRLVAENLKQEAGRDTKINATISSWWQEVKQEYKYDEENMYSAYAKSVLLNWTNRVIFAHLIKNRQNAAMAIDNIDENTTPEEANHIIEGITVKSDFYNIFLPMNYDTLLPNAAWSDLVEFSLFLKDNDIDKLDQSILQHILEQSVSVTKRNMNGQYTTPESLADILVKLTVSDFHEPFMDPCCGTGTIAKAAIRNKEEYLPTKEAVEEVWASDKNQYTLQVANISMAEPDTMNIANRIFQRNVFKLKSGEKIDIKDPTTGQTIMLLLPEFGAIASNLPFVKFRYISETDKKDFEYLKNKYNLSGRSDLSYYIALKLKEILKPNGRLGIILENSWMGTDAGKIFLKALRENYALKQVHVSGRGRWFHNAKVVATIVILENREPDKNDTTDFCLWKSSLKELEANQKKRETLINSAILEEELDSSVMELASYTTQQINMLTNNSLSFSPLFYKIYWLSDILDLLVPIREVYNVIRGNRRGCDAMFFPQQGAHNIESQFLINALFTSKSVKTYEAVPDSKAFCCHLSLDELKSQQCEGTLEWINKFVNQVNRTGEPLPEKLGKGNKSKQWYELEPKEKAEIVTGENPNKRLFFSKFDEPTFINQRLVGLCGKEEYPDKELNFALLNSVITLFYIEGSGFGRADGALDINKDSIANCLMPNPRLFTKEQRDKIVQKFNVMKKREFKDIEDELEMDDRISFENEVFSSLGIEQYYDKIKDTLLSMQHTRLTAKEKV